MDTNGFFVMFKGNPGVLPEGATDLQVCFVVTMGGL